MEEKPFPAAEPVQPQPQLTPEAISYLLNAAKWGKFLSILGFICLIFVLLTGVIFGLVFSLMADKLEAMGGFSMSIPPFWMVFSCIAISVIGFIPISFLNSFSNNITRSVRNNDNAALTLAAKRLKNFFAFIGIYTIVIIAFYLFLLVVAAITAMLSL